MSKKYILLSMCGISNIIMSLIISSKYQLHHPMNSASAFKVFTTFLSNHALLSALWQITFIVTIFIFLVMSLKAFLISKHRHEDGQVIATCISSIFISFLLIVSM